MSELTKALAAFQSELPHIAKGNTAEVPTKSGGKYKYDYADLTDVSEDILPKLAKHGLAWSTAPTHSKHGFSLRYELRHESGETIRGFYPLPAGAPQEIGSAITYARRYALCAVTGVAPGGDDDDAAKAQASTTNRPAARAPRTPPRELISQAVAAVQAAQTLADLDAIEGRAQARGIVGVAELADAITDRRADLAGTTPTDVTEAWAVKDVPA